MKAEIESNSWHKQMTKLVSEERKYLSEYFASIGAKVLSGEGNYILIQLNDELQKTASAFASGSLHNRDKKGHNGPKKQSPVNEEDSSPNPFNAPLCQALAMSKIVIRGCSDFYGMDSSWYRVSIKAHEENVQLVKALVKIFPSEK